MSKIISKPCHKHLKCLSVCPPLWKWARKTRSNRVFRPAGSSSGAHSPSLSLALSLLIKRAPVYPVVFGPGLLHSSASFACVRELVDDSLRIYLSVRCCSDVVNLVAWTWASGLGDHLCMFVCECMCVRACMRVCGLSFDFLPSPASFFPLPSFPLSPIPPPQYLFISPFLY